MTVGSGVSPDLLTLLQKQKALADYLHQGAFTAGGEFHPALRTLPLFSSLNILIASSCLNRGFE
jgi:hypothetical protein